MTQLKLIPLYKINENTYRIANANTFHVIQGAIKFATLQWRQWIMMLRRLHNNVIKS